MARPGEWEVGQLYLGFSRNGLPVWSQPGGVGTQVFPAQPQGEHSALYSALCQHWFNCYEVYEAFNPYTGNQVALLCCPRCSLINQIIEPYSSYANYEDTPIVVG